MTLKERITDQVQEMPLEVSPTQKDIDNYNLSINNLEKIADEFAIGFAEWLLNSSYFFSIGMKEMTFEQVLEIYKTEKEL